MPKNVTYSQAEMIKMFQFHVDAGKSSPPVGLVIDEDISFAVCHLQAPQGGSLIQ